jgi:hypothetical protein
MKNLKMYCVTNKEIKFINKTQYKVGWVGKGSPPKNYIECNSQDNIFFKEKYYSELTFHYWYWQNQLNLNSSNWIGFCQKRRFWIKKESINQSIDEFNYNEHFLNHIPEEYEKFNSIICESISVKGVKKMKLLKRGFKNLIKDPSIFFNKDKHSVKLHFDMHHGYGNISKAANLLPEKDRDEFLEYINMSNTFHPHIMFIAKPYVINDWFNNLFPWLMRCEEVFGFKNLQGYDTQRLYAFLAERYLSFWFKKYTNSTTWPWTFLDFKN